MINDLVPFIWPRRWRPDPEPSYAIEEVVTDKVKVAGEIEDRDITRTFMTVDQTHRRRVLVKFAAGWITVWETTL